MDSTKRLLIIISVLLGIACFYIITEKVDFCETPKNESYALGFNQGVEYWNTMVMYNVNNHNVISYWFNESYYELPIEQRCGVSNG